MESLDIITPSVEIFIWSRFKSEVNGTSGILLRGWSKIKSMSSFLA